MVDSMGNLGNLGNISQLVAASSSAVSAADGQTDKSSSKGTRSRSHTLATSAPLSPKSNSKKVLNPIYFFWVVKLTNLFVRKRNQRERKNRKRRRLKKGLSRPDLKIKCATFVSGEAAFLLPYLQQGFLLPQ